MHDVLNPVFIQHIKNLLIDAIPEMPDYIVKLLCL